MSNNKIKHLAGDIKSIRGKWQTTENLQKININLNEINCTS